MSSEHGLAELIDEILCRTVQRLRQKATPDTELPLVLAPLTLGELIERLAILHCRLWAIEDSIRASHISDAERSRLAQLIIEINSVTRPTLVRSIDTLLAAACQDRHQLTMPAPKVYATGVADTPQ
jgi:hypothetical protein